MKRFLEKVIYWLGKRGIVLPTPLHLVFEITDDCNLKCKMCMRKLGDTKNEYITFEQFRKVVDEAWMCRKVIFVGRGEMLMHPDIYKMMDYVQTKEIRLITNGTLIDAEKLSKYKRLVLGISVDSADPKEFKEIRGFDLSFLKKKIKECVNAGIRVRLKSMLIPEHTHPEKIIDMAVELGAAEVYYDECCCMDKETRAADDIGYDRNPLRHYGKMSGKVLVLSPDCPEAEICYDPYTYLVIGVDGTAYPCSYAFKARGDWNERYLDTNITFPMKEYSLGNVFKESVWEIWHKRYGKLRYRANRVAERKFSAEGLRKYRENYTHIWTHDFCNVCLKRWKRACI